MESPESKYLEKRQNIYVPDVDTNTLNNSEKIAARGAVLFGSSNASTEAQSKAQDLGVLPTEKWDEIAKRKQLKRGCKSAHK